MNSLYRQRRDAKNEKRSTQLVICNLESRGIQNGNTTEKYSSGLNNGAGTEEIKISAFKEQMLELMALKNKWSYVLS
ncbi:hypothetical protein AYI68_g8381 [Smittium mucronatum]|uniref:Uncharacterized protein n=1 Tax=Smittium mucronatum TaxID=133383 RepID=A0A1R0GL22_9FUNG|nr:hypothetical protein AYI68_g8381 [Smittium mucronatum]